MMNPATTNTPLRSRRMKTRTKAGKIRQRQAGREIATVIEMKLPTARIFNVTKWRLPYSQPCGAFSASRN